MSVALAYNIDRKIDDGFPYSGNVRRGAEWVGAYGCEAGCGWTGGNCVATVGGISQYNITSAGSLCNLAFINKF